MIQYQIAGTSLLILIYITSTYDNIKIKRGYFHYNNAMEFFDRYIRISKSLNSGLCDSCNKYELK